MGEKNPWEISDWTGGEEIISFPCKSALPSLKKKNIWFAYNFAKHMQFCLQFSSENYLHLKLSAETTIPKNGD